MPQYGGFCANSMRKREIRDIDPNQFLIYKRELYVCTSAHSLKEFSAKPDENIQAADKNWELYQLPSSPGFNRYFGSCQDSYDSSFEGTCRRLLAGSNRLMSGRLVPGQHAGRDALPPDPRQTSNDRVRCSASDGRCAPARPALHVGTRLWTCCAGRAGNHRRSEALHRMSISDNLPRIARDALP